MRREFIFVWCDCDSFLLPKWWKTATNHGLGREIGGIGATMYQKRQKHKNVNFEGILGGKYSIFSPSKIADKLW
jgi:hypothetical protein